MTGFSANKRRKLVLTPVAVEKGTKAVISMKAEKSFSTATPVFVNNQFPTLRMSITVTRRCSEVDKRK